MKKNKNILICPLDWGIGHASRCIPIIEQLLRQKANVLVGAGGRTASFLKSCFPGIQIVPVEGYNIHYPSGGSMAVEMLRQTPKLLRAIRREHQQVSKIIDAHNIHAVISDNRFGMWSPKTYSIYITHQVKISAPGMMGITEQLLHRFHNHYIQKYDECWIPDLPERPGLAGDLSHTATDGNCFFIGPQSRFNPALSSKNGERYDLMVIISGPEPQRSIFEKMVLDQLGRTNYKAIVLLGKPEAPEHSAYQRRNVFIYPHLNTKKMQKAMESSSLIVSRPGYSSIMDMAVLGLQAAFVPTPGQTEQIYLARLHHDQKHYFSTTQKAFDLEELIRSSKNFEGLKIVPDHRVLHERVAQLLDRI
ncbi:MAG: glycosyltransferase [Bacteroidales bacterium]|nr:glycosyltransferase [Bacteroidales bacterium]